MFESARLRTQDECRHVKPGGWKDQIQLGIVEDLETSMWILHQMKSFCCAYTSRIVPNQWHCAVGGWWRFVEWRIRKLPPQHRHWRSLQQGWKYDVPSTIVDAFEMDLSPVSSTVPASVGVVQRRIGRATPHLRRVVLMPQSAGTTVRPRCQF